MDNAPLMTLMKSRGRIRIIRNFNLRVRCRAQNYAGCGKILIILICAPLCSVSYLSFFLLIRLSALRPRFHQDYQDPFIFAVWGAGMNRRAAASRARQTRAQSGYTHRLLAAPGAIGDQLKGKVVHAVIEHDPWCGIYRREGCNCVPLISLGSFRRFKPSLVPRGRTN